MLDLLSNAVGANLILLFLLIAMTGAQPPKGGRPPDGAPRQPSLFLEVESMDPATEFAMVLFPPPGVTPASLPVEFTRVYDSGPPPGPPPRAIHVPELTQGCWRLGIMYLSTAKADELWAEPVNLAINFWLAGLRPANTRRISNWQGRIDVKWPKDPSSFAPQRVTSPFSKSLHLDPNKITFVDIHLLDEFAPKLHASACEVVDRSAFAL